MAIVFNCFFLIYFQQLIQLNHKVVEQSKTEELEKDQQKKLDAARDKISSLNEVSFCIKKSMTIIFNFFF